MWFTFALLSALFGGLHMFLLKMSVEKKYDTYLLSATSSFVSAVAGCVVVAVTTGWGAVPTVLYWVGALSGVLFAGFSIARMEGLRYIDAAIFFPLYKVIGPALVALIGIALLNEGVTPIELLGIILSCLVPILLITRQENGRQKNLKLGLILMVVGTTLASLGAAVNSIAVDDFPALALPMATLANFFTFITASLLYFRRHPQGELYHTTKGIATRGFMAMSLVNGLMQLTSFYFLLLAFAVGNLSLVYSINAHYIVIPVILSVIFYKEHWNKQKALALAISVLALVLLHR